MTPLPNEPIDYMKIEREARRLRSQAVRAHMQSFRGWFSSRSA